MYPYLSLTAEAEQEMLKTIERQVRYRVFSSTYVSSLPPFVLSIY